MRSHAKAPSAASIPDNGTNRALFGVACACVLALAVFAGSGAPSAGAVEDPCPNARFRQGVGALLPGCRAYEQVSPRQKNGSDAGYRRSADPQDAAPVSATGDAAAFFSMGAFADSAQGGKGTLAYLSQRGTTGWTTKALDPPALDIDRPVSTLVTALSPDFGFAIEEAGQALTPEGGSESKYFYYLRNNATGALQLLLSIGDGGGTALASADLAHLAIATPSLASSEPDQPDEFTLKVYEVVNGQTRLVSRGPDNQPLPETSVLGGGGVPGSVAGAMSSSGAHIFFSSPANFSDEPGMKIYRRSNGVSTLMVSPSKRSTPDPNGERAKSFHVATADGNRVFFTTPEQLTDDSNSSTPGVVYNGDLYRYDIGSDSLVDLTAGTAGSEPAEVQGVVEISEDGDRAYYVALGRVVPGEGVEGQPNLYLWEDDGTAQGVTRFITTLDADTLANAANNPPDGENWIWSNEKLAQASEDGTRLLFQSRLDLSGYEQNGFSQIYLYDADGNGGAGRFLCLSCGSEPVVGASYVPTGPGIADLGQVANPRIISKDGNRIVFSTPNALLPRDTNGVMDAYLWQDGELSLLSSGSSNEDSWAYAMSANGDDAFFRTREQLVPGDGDTLIDLYTAHVNGGFASQQRPAPPDCEGEACRGPGTAPPAAVDIISAVHEGAGNQPRCAKYFRQATGFKNRARRLRQQAGNAEGLSQAQALRHRADALSKKSKGRRAKGKRCQTIQRGAGR